MSIRSCASSETEKLHQTGKSRRLGNIAKVALRKLDMLVAAADLTDMRAPPGNRLEELSGDREGQHSIRINDPFRICFVWTAEGPAGVEIVDRSQRMRAMTHITTHPGEILSEAFMVPLGLSATRLAAALAVPANRITAIVNGSRGITADTALLLGRYFHITPEFWLNLQQSYELSKARMETGAGTVERVPEMAA